MVQARVGRKISVTPAGGVLPESSQGVYGISAAAELVGSAPQNLRLYEARGLISAARSEGGTRRYSDDDLARLRQIGQLLDDGLNLAGVAAVLALLAINQTLQVELDQAHQQAPSRPLTVALGPAGSLSFG
jgi:MerR family transcriptional regulator/heat shock protein HspR